MDSEGLTLAGFWDQIRPQITVPAASRVYEGAPSSHPSWKAIMGGVFVSMLTELQERGGIVSENVATKAALGHLAAKHDFPMYWVDRSFLECVLRSDPPADFTTGDLQWPFPAMIFVLPKDTLSHETDGDCSWILIGNLAGEIPCAFGGDAIQMRNLSIVAMTAPWAGSSPPTFNFGVPGEADFCPFKPLPDFGPGTVEDFREGKGLGVPGKLTAADDDLGQMMIQLGLRLILALTARPEYLSPPVAGKTKKDKATGKPREFLTPRWAGRGHAIKAEKQGDAVGHVRMHWRRGHYKNQPHGSGRSLRKVVWIEPYLAGAP